MIDWDPYRFKNRGEGKEIWCAVIFDGPECDHSKNHSDSLELNADSKEEAVQKVLDAGYYTTKRWVYPVAFPDWDKHPDRDWCNN